MKEQGGGGDIFYIKLQGKYVFFKVQITIKKIILHDADYFLGPKAQSNLASALKL